MLRTLAAALFALLVLAAPASAGVPPLQPNLVVSMTDSPDPVTAGQNLTYTVTVLNDGNDSATSTTMSDVVPAQTTFVSLTAPAGWTCTTPAVGATGTVTCSISSLGPFPATFTLVVQVDAGATAGTTISNTATASTSQTESSNADNSATATTNVTAAAADLALSMSDTPDPVLPGGNVTSTITLDQDGPMSADDVTLTMPLAPEMRFQSLSVPGGWTCTTPAVGAGGTVTCSRLSLAAGSSVFTLVTQVGPATPSGSSIVSTASVTSSTADPDADDTSASEATAVTGDADLRATVTAAPARMAPGEQATATITVVNDGPRVAADATLTSALPAGTRFVSLDAPAGWTCTTPPAGTRGTVACTRPALAVGAPQRFALVLRIDQAAATMATAGSAAPDPDMASNTATASLAMAALPQPPAGPAPVAAPPPWLAPAPAGRRLACRRVPRLVRHSISGARWILARDGCRVRLRWVGRYRPGGRKRNRIIRQSVRPGTALSEGFVLYVRIGTPKTRVPKKS